MVTNVHQLHATPRLNHTQGFFQCINAPIDPQLVAEFYSAKAAFFTELPREHKAAVKRTKSNSKGWFDDELTKQKLDWKEGFDIGAQDGSLDLSGLDGANQWPDESAVGADSIVGFQSTVKEYYAACEAFARSLTCAMTAGLGMPSEILVEKHFDASVHS